MLKYATEMQQAHTAQMLAAIFQPYAIAARRLPRLMEVKRGSEAGRQTCGS